MNLHDEYLVITEQTSLKNLRGAVSRDLYCRNAEYDQMPMLLTFKFTQWLRKEHRTVKVVFDYDGKEDDPRPALRLRGGRKV